MTRRRLMTCSASNTSMLSVTLSESELRTMAWAMARYAQDWAVKYGRCATVSRYLKLATQLFNSDGYSGSYFKLSSNLKIVCAEKPYGLVERDRRRKQSRQAHVRYMSTQMTVTS